MWRLILLAIIGQASTQDYKISVVNLTNTLPADGNRIIGGIQTSIEAFPYAVQITYSSRLLCGGSLITRHHVLTAAHCFISDTGLLQPSAIRVRMGTDVTNSGGDTYRVSTIILHEGFNIPARDNDVAVMLLSSRVSTSRKVAVASLPMQGNTVPDNANLIYVGWGVTQVGAQTAAPSLRSVSVQKVNQAVCTSRYAQLLAVGAPFIVTPNMMCAGDINVGGRDACQGDSGGPLVYNGVVVGIISWGYRCGDAFYPGVNAFVPNYNVWIQSTVQRYSAGSAISPLSVLILLVAAVSTKMLNI